MHFGVRSHPGVGDNRKVLAKVSAKRTLKLAAPTIVAFLLGVTACTSPNVAASDRIVSATARAAADSTPSPTLTTSVRTPTVTVTVVPTSSRPSTASAGVVKSAGAKPSRKPIPPPKRAVQLAGDTVFTTPSENIACGRIHNSGMFCAIGRKAWKFPADLQKPSDCTKPQAVALTSRVHAWCLDTGFSKQKIVPYGTVVEVNGFRCVVERRGVMCAGNKTRDRFSISESKLTYWPRTRQTPKPTS